MWTDRLLAFAEEVGTTAWRSQSRASHHMIAKRLRCFADSARVSGDAHPARLLDTLADHFDGYAECIQWQAMTPEQAEEVADLFKAITKLVPTAAERGAA